MRTTEVMGPRRGLSVGGNPVNKRTALIDRPSFTGVAKTDDVFRPTVRFASLPTDELRKTFLEALRKGDLAVLRTSPYKMTFEDQPALTEATGAADDAHYARLIRSLFPADRPRTAEDMQLFSALQKQALMSNRLERAAAWQGEGARFLYAPRNMRNDQIFFETIAQNGNVPLVAFVLEHIETSNRMIERGAPPTPKQKPVDVPEVLQGMFSANLQSEKPHLEVLSFLLKKGVDPNLLFRFEQESLPDEVRRLCLEAGADPFSVSYSWERNALFNGAEDAFTGRGNDHVRQPSLFDKALLNEGDVNRYRLYLDYSTPETIPALKEAIQRVPANTLKHRVLAIKMRIAQLESLS